MALCRLAALGVIEPIENCGIGVVTPHLRLEKRLCRLKEPQAPKFAFLEPLGLRKQKLRSKHIELGVLLEAIS